jgi:predicted helicase
MQVFRLHPRFAQTTKELWLYSDITPSKRKKLNMPDRDMGIDILLKMTDGKYYGIQSKFRMNKFSNILWKDLGTFVAEATERCWLNGGIFVTNTYQINEELQECKNIVSLCGNFFENLDGEFFALVNSYLEKGSVSNSIDQIIKPRQPRAHQTMFVNKAISYFKENNRGYGNLACGSGKTLAAFWIWKNLNLTNAVICVPSLYLLSQFYQEWQRECIALKTNIPFLLIGSDISSVDLDDDRNNGLFLTTDEKQIHEFIQTKNAAKSRYIIITTYQSCDKLIMNSNKGGFDLCIFDEAHKTTGDLNGQFATLLHDKNVKFNKRLFITATPRVYSNIGDDNEEILSMNDESWYGKEIYRYSIRDGIRDKHLCDYEIVTLLTDDTYIKQFIDDNKLVDLWNIKAIPTHYVVSAIMIYKAFKDNICNHLLTYHNTVKNSKLFSDILGKIFKIDEDDTSHVNISQIDGNYSMINREKIINEFRSKSSAILTSSRVMSEGVDIPIIDAVAFIDQRNSTIDINQSTGRAMRLYPDKMISRILVPFVCDDINDLDDGQYFPQIVKIIKSLSDSDESILEYFSTTDKGKKMNDIIKFHSYQSKQTVIKIGTKFNVQSWIDGIKLSVWKKVDHSSYMFQKLQSFIDKKNGDFPSLKSDDPDEVQLARWCYKRRERKKEGKLSIPEIKQLESITGWYWEDTSRHSNLSFDNKISLLKNWINNPNNKRIPSEYSKDEEEAYLGKICTKLRGRYNKGKLTEYQINELEKLPFWYWKTNATILSIEEWIKLMSKWIEEHPIFPSAYSSNKLEKSLASFITRVRKLYKQKKLTNDQIDKLEKIPGWSWGRSIKS